MRERLELQLKQIRQQLAEINGKLSKRTKIIIAIAAILVVAIAFAAAFALNKVSYGVLYTGLSESEAVEVMSLLETQSIPYKSSGGVIYVPDDQVDKIKVNLATQGYPKSGFTYDVFTNNVDLLTTDFEKSQYALFDLQNRMASNIKLFAGVKDATVTIALANEQKYVLEEDKKESTASVVVVMKDGEAPSKEKVKGIQRLVAKGVPGLEISNVEVVDGNGEAVTDNGEESQEGSTQLKMAVEKQTESSIKGKILHLLQPVFGQENIRVSVKCSVDIDKKIKEIINYIPSQDNKGVISKENTNYEIQGQGTVSSGIVGTESNADIPVYPGVTTDGNDVYFENQRAFDYLVSQVKEQVQSDAGELTDTTVSVAVDSADLTNKKAQELRELIAVTAGIPVDQADSKIAIFNANFYQEDTVPTSGLVEIFEQHPYLKFLIPAVIALLIALALVAVLLIKRAKVKKQAAELANEELPPDQNVEELLRLDDIAKSREEELREQIRDFADTNPEISAQLLKTWIRGGEQDE
ncbi:flagellar basal-body MS-ring/collar protein FliF [Clostridium aminobutyricum]|uniref:Flagellar M-ring protein FliF n=1 Tax=Clostridium aminobutyricum TaxID=33953 RepID=A0A939IHH6_CLOAM|nr:flagellar basal-body MS-ring/collar protein FliF [Clostridium aminobutyricum]MBN7773772.1 flagellar M-ring protein FliF [Clostridium aminobutyricum]